MRDRRAEAVAMRVWTEREQGIIRQIVAAGFPEPTEIRFAASGNSISVGFLIQDVTERFEGCGSSDREAAGHVVKQLRQRLPAHPPRGH
jgi:hypothetical protein